MNKRLIRVDGDDFTGWCCSHCPWDMITPRLESTVAALALTGSLRKLLKSTGATTALAESHHARAHLVSLAVLS
jgi:hypothetical protein